MCKQVLQLYVNAFLSSTIQIWSRPRFVLVVFVFLDKLINNRFSVKLNISDVVIFYSVKIIFYTFSVPIRLVSLPNLE